MDRADLESALANAKLLVGRAALHGHTDLKADKAIADITRELELLDYKEQARVKEQREQSAEQHAEQVKATKTEIADFQSASAKAKAAADKALAEYVSALKLHYQHAEQTRRAIGKLNTLAGSQEPAPDIKALQKEDSLRAIQEFRKLSGHPSEFGCLRLPMNTKTL